MFWLGLLIGSVAGVAIMVVLICSRLNDEDWHEVKKGSSPNGDNKEL